MTEAIVPPPVDTGAIKMFNELVTLRCQSGSSLFRRLVLADKLLRRADWVTSLGGEVPALERLEHDAFGDVTGLIHLSDLLELARREPVEETWRQHKYNVRSLLVEVRKRDRKDRPPTPADPRPPRPEYKDILIKQLKEEVRGLRKELIRERREVKRLRARLKRIGGEVIV